MHGAVKQFEASSRLFTSVRTINTASKSREIIMEKVYELRCYKIFPHCLKPFLALTQEHLHLRTAHSRLLGYWTSELGALNEVVHIWEYDSLEQRAGVRVALANDPKWISDYFSKILPMMSSQENSVCQVLPGTNIDLPLVKGSAYNLITLNFNGPKTKWETPLSSLLSELREEGHLVGTFLTLHGNVNQVVLLVQHSTLTQGAQLVRKFDSFTHSDAFWSAVNGVQSKLMLPFSLSPLQ